MQADVGGSTEMSGLPIVTGIFSVPQTPQLTPSKSQPATHGTTASLVPVDITELRLLLSVHSKQIHTQRVPPTTLYPLPPRQE